MSRRTGGGRSSTRGAAAPRPGGRGVRGLWRVGEAARRLSARPRPGALRVGWVTAGRLAGRDPSFFALEHAVAMRVAGTALWLERHGPPVACELYRPERGYDVVVFFKAMDDRCLAEAERLKAAGTRVVFDANVNYYETWGEYDIADTQPTEEQQRQALAMTRLADHVVADSTRLLEVVRGVNSAATWIPDNVDARRFRPGERRAGSGLRLVWSGIARKAKPLLEVAPALAAVPGVELVVVSNERPAALDGLAAAGVRCRYVPWQPARYARVLRGCDAIVSPKRLVNAYEVCHTEYKITLGMAAGLPAVASPQQSYVEAIGWAGGGIVADGVDEWRDALARLAGDPALRAELGARARRTVEERYATPVVAAQYGELLCSLA